MVAQDLRSAIDALDEAGQLLRINAPISVDYEAAAVLWEVAHGPAVLFDNVVGSTMPLVGNLLNTREKLAISLEVSEGGLQERLMEAVERRMIPEVVSDPFCQQWRAPEGSDFLGRLPVPLISENDGGRYISAGLLVCRDPETARQNLAICRLQVKPGNRLGCYMAPTHSYRALVNHRRSRTPMEVAVAIGCHPAVMAASQFLTPFDEMEIAGGIFGEPLGVARCQTVNLVVPAAAEVVLEGSIDPCQSEVEGPFGEFPGTYAPARPNPVIHLSAMTSRSDPWMQMIVGGRHPEHLVTGAVAREATLLASVRAVVPGVRRVVLTEGGNCRFHAVIAMAPSVPGEAKLAITAAFASQDLIKHVVVVDDDVDPGDPDEVEWAVSTRMRAPEDILMVGGMKSNPVDPTSVGRTITKVGFDATLAVDDDRRGERRVGVPEAVARRVHSRWDEIMGR